MSIKLALMLLIHPKGWLVAFIFGILPIVVGIFLIVSGRLDTIKKVLIYAWLSSLTYILTADMIDEFYNVSIYVIHSLILTEMLFIPLVLSIVFYIKKYINKKRNI